MTKKLKQHRKDGKKIAFTNGCFDILHFGHISYLERAKKRNRILVVGLNSDSSIKKIKGPPRPILSQKERAHILAALAAVDYVTIFNDSTPYRLIKTIQPDILIKGADWGDKEVVGSDIVEKNDGRVELIPYIKNFSTTNIIQRIIEKSLVCAK